MLYCFDMEAYNYFDYMEHELKLSKKMKNGILYKNNIFTDFKGKKVDIKDKIIMPLTGIYQVKELNEQIINNGGIPSTSNDKYNIIVNWPDYIDTYRKVKRVTGRELLDNVSFIEKEYGKEIFFKTKDKNFSNVIPIDVLKNKETVFSKTLEKHSDDEFIISKKVDISYDELGEEEYRCIIINNELYNISRRTIHVLHKIDSDVLEVANSFVERLRNSFPNNYVLDLFRYKEGNKSCIDAVELNPVEGAGIYLYNSRLKKSNDLLHNNIKDVAEEFKYNLDNCSTEGKMLEGSTNNYRHLLFTHLDNSLITVFNCSVFKMGGSQ